jgi:hypothetical protein
MLQLEMLVTTCSSAVTPTVGCYVALPEGFAAVPGSRQRSRVCWFPVPL